MTQTNIDKTYTRSRGLDLSTRATCVLVNSNKIQVHKIIDNITERRHENICDVTFFEAGTLLALPLTQ